MANNGLDKVYCPYAYLQMTKYVIFTYTCRIEKINVLYIDFQE